MAALPLLLPHSLHHRRQLPNHRNVFPTLSSPQLLRLHPTLTCKKRSFTTTGAGYITGPASDAIIAADDPKIEEVDTGPEPVQRFNAISLGLLLRLLSRHKLRVAASIVSLVCCTTCTLSMPILSGRFFEVLIGARSEPLWQLLSKVGVLYTLEPIFTVIFVVNMNTIWEKVMSSLRAQIFGSVLIHKVEFFDKYKVGELTALLTSDLGSFKNIVSENISRDRGFRALTEASYSTLSKSYWDNVLAVCACPPTCTNSGCTYACTVYKRSTVKVFKAYGSTQASIADCVTETFSAIRTVRSFGGEKRQMLTFGNQVLAYQSSGIKLGFFKSINESITRVAVYVSLLALYILGGSKVQAGELSVGTVASFIGYTFTLTFAVQGLVNTVGDLRGAFAATERINSVLSESEVDQALAHGLEKDIRQEVGMDDSLKMFFISDPNDKRRSQNMRYMSSLTAASSVRSLAQSGDICLEASYLRCSAACFLISLLALKCSIRYHEFFAGYVEVLFSVHFSYPLRSDVEVLSGLDLTLKYGSVTALVGSSGAGKSTIVQLLARFYEASIYELFLLPLPTQGRITVAGEDLRTFDKSEWARVVSIVNQEPVLFSVSVGENIAYGLPDENVSRDDVIAAAKAANAHDFIVSLPEGYDTLVGERGGLLSGGQRQRVAIARALLKNAPILILDEATSALDTVSERLVQDALNHLMKGRTTLVIAHRLSTVQNADQIALCSEGKIAELGSHSELLARKGQYASLVGTQRLAFDYLLSHGSRFQEVWGYADREHAKLQ
ncbi:AAA+ ATPase domain-containing protein [Cynara cardunculus var. scolymus]|uniref:AAA+ ATPase domain-containing protein n=1 Tax=Cynara cardunculus var. scolymus TaxID=59895 RepID=A0A103XD10_CYNCS|nr:AAA+ ATPase domain-containing protein [Cynara cardunculus var. scolymus]